MKTFRDGETSTGMMLIPGSMTIHHLVLTVISGGQTHTYDNTVSLSYGKGKYQQVKSF
jgi:hypothetical protein